MQELISRTSESRCVSCGLALGTEQRFCPSCGTRVLPLKPPPIDAEPATVIHGTLVPSTPPSERRRRPWGLIGPLVVAGLAMAVLTFWLVSVGSTLSDTETELTRERSRVTRLSARTTSLEGQLDDLKAENTSLEEANSSLQTAMVDCRDAAFKTRRVLKTAFLVSQGRASLTDFRSAANVAQSAWSVCRTEAATNGSL